MSNCDNKIAVSIAADACNPVTKGIKSLGYICNFDDINHAAMTKTDGSNSYESLELNSGKYLYRIYQQGKTPFTGATSEAQVGTYRTTWNKTLPLIILANGADVAENIIDKLANGKFVAVIENAFAGTGGDNTFEIIGLETGLMLSEGNNEKYNDDYGGGWSLTLVEENAPSSALYVFGTSVAATRSALEAQVYTPTA